MEPGTICQFLEWDSNFFGRRIGRITTGILTPAIISEVMRWCDAQAIDCLYFLADMGDPDTSRLAEDNGFHLVDIRITLECHLTAAPLKKSELHTYIRPSTPDDLPALRSIAKISYHDSRFYHDPNFPNSLCDKLYETWIEKSCNGYADAVLVAELDRQAVGYITCRKLDQTTGHFGLLGVNPDVQGRGIGQSLIGEGLQWFSERGLSRACMITQGRNYKSQRIFQRYGFSTSVLQLWYHRWFLP
jgi:dTDP-4-amino-4,6-dideoxy-D-galactose acyltransferase